MSFDTGHNQEYRWCCDNKYLLGTKVLFCTACGKALAGGVTVGPHTKEMHISEGPADFSGLKYGQRTLETTEPVKPEPDMQKVINGLKAQGLIEEKTVETTSTKPSRPPRIVGMTVLVTLDSGETTTLYDGKYGKPLSENELFIEQKRDIKNLYDGPFGRYGAVSGFQQDGPMTFSLTVIDRSNDGKKVG